jgi:uncharacterized membrane protein (UPF0127 family)
MRKLTKILILVVVIISLGFLAFLSAEFAVSPSLSLSKQNKVCFNSAPGGCFFVELAKNDAERETGLMYRTEMPKDHGMLFIFDKEGIYSFWMKNTLIPLDMIWIDGNNKVVFVNQNSQPCKTSNCPSTNPNVKAKYVLEINAGISKEMGIKAGDKIWYNEEK